MTSCKLHRVLFTLSGLKVKICRFTLKFVSHWIDVIDYKLYLNQKKKITKLSFILKIIKNNHYISLICSIKNIRMYK